MTTVDFIRQLLIAMVLEEMYLVEANMHWRDDLRHMFEDPFPWKVTRDSWYASCTNARGELRHRVERYLSTGDMDALYA